MYRNIALALLLTTTSAQAGTVTKEKDQLTDRIETWASAVDKDATLPVGCMNGQVMPRLTWARPVGIGSGIGVLARERRAGADARGRPVQSGRANAVRVANGRRVSDAGQAGEGEARAGCLRLRHGEGRPAS